MELDSKEKQIAELKAEIYEMRQNEKDFHDLSAQLKNLEHRFALIQDEKVMSKEICFRPD